MRFKVGEKVIVKSFSERPEHWNFYGEMDKWMGKIVTIRKYRKIGKNPYSIEEDKLEYHGDGWHWKESDFLPIPKPGDRVKLRTWEDMERQYGLDGDRDIDTPIYTVVQNMKKYCGTMVTVKTLKSDYFFIENDTCIFGWGFETIEEVYPKEEKMEFTKDMLKSGEHVVKYRNGERRLYLNGILVDWRTWADIECYSRDLKNSMNSERDIIAVYKADKQGSLDSILSCSDDLIWRRDEEPIEIPSSEAFAKLREIYGKEVKIVEDKE